MADTKETMLDSLVTNLGGLTSVQTATRILLPPAEANAASPYIGVLSSAEENLVEDSTHTRWGVTVDLVLVAPMPDMEDLIVIVKNYVQTGALPTGAVQMIIVGQEPVNILNQKNHSTSRVVLDIMYVTARGAN